MPFITKVTVTAQVGAFQPTTFTDLLQTSVLMPGLDPAWRHTLINVSLSTDRTQAELTMRSEPRGRTSLDRNLRVVNWQPTARVRVHDAAGKELAALELDAPLQPGQQVEFGGTPYRIGPDITHPNRRPGHGTTARGDLDWQHVTLTPDPQPVHMPVADTE